MHRRQQQGIVRVLHSLVNYERILMINFFSSNDNRNSMQRTFVLHANEMFIFLDIERLKTYVK